MISFKGTVEHSVEAKIKKKERNAYLITAIFTFVVFGAIVVAVSLLFDLICLLFLVVCATFSIMLVIPQKGFEKRLPREITIDGEAVFFYSDMVRRRTAISSVKKVYDRGDCYEIVFYFPDKNLYCFCAKDLVERDALEAFEALFKDKLIISDESGYYVELAALCEKYGAKIASYSYYKRVFGNFVVKIDYAGERHTFVTDRGEIHLDSRFICDSSYHVAGQGDTFPKLCEVIVQELFEKE